MIIALLSTIIIVSVSCVSFWLIGLWITHDSINDCTAEKFFSIQDEYENKNVWDVRYSIPGCVLCHMAVAMEIVIGFCVILVIGGTGAGILGSIGWLVWWAFGNL